MKTCPKKTRKNKYIKDCKEQPRKTLTGKEQIYCFEPKKIYELETKKFSNSFFLLAKEQTYSFEPKKIYELEMKKFSNSFFLLAKEQIYSFEPKKTHELEMKTCPKETKTDRDIKDCKEQPREIRDQRDIQPLCNTLERMVRPCEVSRRRRNNRPGTGLRKLEPMLDCATK